MFFGLPASRRRSLVFRKTQFEYNRFRPTFCYKCLSKEQASLRCLELLAIRVRQYVWGFEGIRKDALSSNEKKLSVVKDARSIRRDGAQFSYQSEHNGTPHIPYLTRNTKKHLTLLISKGAQRNITHLSS